MSKGTVGEPPRPHTDLPLGATGLRHHVQVRLRYADPIDASHAVPRVIEVEVGAETDLIEILAAVRLQPPGQRGHPSVDLERGDGSCLTVGYAGELAYLRWIDSLGASYHSGAADDARELLVFDYFGSWTEIPKGCCIPAADATAAALSYFCSGRPEHDRVLLEPD